MEAQSLHRQLASYAKQKQELISQLTLCKQWFAEHHQTSAECQQGLDRALEKLHKASFTIACTGDFYRGKTELINALLMPGSQFQPFPSESRGTIQSPVEIFFDAHSHPNSLRLLPIETRLKGSTLSKTKDNPKLWLNLSFDLSDASTTQHIISQLTRTKVVTADTARELGFNPTKLPRSNKTPELLEIPAWRFAQLNIELPLLKLGLKIVDLPGLNTFDYEPELTFNDLPKADAILFLLAADEDSNKSDQSIWKKHLREQQAPVITVLNKIDTLWDVSQTAEALDQKLLRLRRNTALNFRQPIEQIIGLSAQIALAAHVTGDPLQRFKSKLPELESSLCELLSKSQKALFKHHLISDAIAIIDSSHLQLKEQTYSVDTELEKLQRIHLEPQRFEHSINQLLRSKRLEYDNAKRQELDQRSHQARLETHYRAMKKPFEKRHFNPLLNACQQQLLECRSVKKLNSAVAEIFVKLQAHLDLVDAHATQANALLADNYRRAASDVTAHGAFRHAFDLSPQRIQLLKLQTRARLFLASYNPQQSTRHPIIRRLIHALLQTIYWGGQAVNEAMDNWLTESMAPIRHHSQYQKDLTEQLVMQLTNISQRQVSQRDPMIPLKRLISEQERALFELDRLITRLRDMAIASHDTQSIRKRYAAIHLT